MEKVAFKIADMPDALVGKSIGRGGTIGIERESDAIDGKGGGSPRLLVAIEAAEETALFSQEL